ncbi:rod shape-determining protein MreC [Blastomonas fulva]|jgi:rod shape-determining protein MreC|uniref:rod shape-determining protein MreC n=1 Tax=Blastomonas fulva TaxID=1550728 RepID=UPI0025A439E3|nr:rod shape-determining protein MreC [Blastomonas fulva]MDM7930020.1 rod shape-determining protein MreC [Blastomonas fulva]MDM7966215.1 rod shape-determining protein MreC [Blastomonas fulva]
MAPPRKRRPGFSRKAQLQIFTGYLLAFTGAFAGLLLLALSYFDPAAFSAVRSMAAEVTAPPARLLTGVRVSTQTGWREVAAYFEAGSKNARLQREVERNRVRLIEARALKQENRELRRLLGLIKQEGRPVATARLINSSASSSRRFATLDVGSRQGVQRSQPVRGQRGLIGRVLETGPNTSRVLLLSDPENVVPVRRARDGVVAFSQGRGDGRVDIKLIDIGINPFKVGDVMVTSGNGGIYPPNVPVAIIEKLTSDGAIGKLLANPAGTDFVIVQEMYEPELVNPETGSLPPVSAAPASTAPARRPQQGQQQGRPASTPAPANPQASPEQAPTAAATGTPQP